METLIIGAGRKPAQLAEPASVFPRSITHPFQRWGLVEARSFVDRLSGSVSNGAVQHAAPDEWRGQAKLTWDDNDSRSRLSGRADQAMISKEGKLASLGVAALFAPVIWWAGAGLLLERVFQVERGPLTAGVLLAGTVVLLVAGLVYGLRLPSDDRHLIVLGAVALLVILTVTTTVQVVIGLGLGIVSRDSFFRPDFSRACLVCASSFYRVWLPGDQSSHSNRCTRRANWYERRSGTFSTEERNR